MLRQVISARTQPSRAGCLGIPNVILGVNPIGDGDHTNECYWYKSVSIVRQSEIELGKRDRSGTTRIGRMKMTRPAINW